MAEKIEVERLPRARSERGHVGADPIGIERRARKRSKSTGFCHGKREIETGEIRHRRADDRQLDMKKIDKPPVSPHGPRRSTLVTATFAEKAQAERVQLDEALGVLLVVDARIVLERDHLFRVERSWARPADDNDIALVEL